MIETLQSVDPDLPIIIVAALGLLVLAVVASLIIAAFAGPIERRVGQAAKELNKLETGEGGEPDMKTIFAWAFGALLVIFTFAGVVSVAKGFYPGPIGKGIGMFLFVAVAVTMWAFVALIRKGHRKWVLGAGAALAIALAISGSRVATVEEVADDANEAIAGAVAELGEGVAELQQEIASELSAAGGELGDELFDAANNRIRLVAEDAEASDGQQQETPENPSAMPESDSPDIDEPIVIGKPTEPLPDWVAAEGSDDEMRISSDPFLFKRECREDVQQQLAAIAIQRFNEASPTDGGETLRELPPAIAPADLLKRFVEQEHYEKRPTSVGDTFVLHVLAELDDEDRGWFNDIARAHLTDERRRSGVLAVSVTGGGLLVGLGVLYGVLSVGQGGRA